MSFLREPDAEPIPDYRLIEPLGSGGFGEVWKCEGPGGLLKAIKFVYGNLNSLDGDSARASQEFSALKHIKDVRYPFVLSMDRIDIVDGELAIVMEWADKSLHDKFMEHQAEGLVGIPRDDLLRYIRDAADALDHMIEKHNLQHLDIKPRNLFLISDRVKVADFGLVKDIERQSGMLASVTPLYAAPETFNGKISEHSDQYSLAIVYQELLTGQRPFNGKNARQLAMQHINEEPELRALPEAERPVVARALAKDPAKRFPSCLAFVRGLYMARGPSTAEQIILGKGPRSRTLNETLENIQLEQMDDEAAGSIFVPQAGEGTAANGPDAGPVSELGITVQQPQTGVLRPTLVLGLGSFGRRALLELRCRFVDRFGDLSKIPLLHFLYVDSDGEAAKSALRGAPEMACSSAEVYHLPLQPVGNYRRRMIEQLNEWMPREKLYAMPRSLQTQGSRALGRLAFADNHFRLMARLRREIQQVAHPDSLFQSVNQTGLALRDNRPRIYIVAAAGGGSSGLLVDFGYAIKKLLNQLRHPDADIFLFLFCGAPEDPATPRPEQANVYATLTELNHFADPSIPFSAQYGPDAARIVDHGSPYNNIYLMRLTHRSPESLRDAVAHLGSYLFHEFTTPLGVRLDRGRQLSAGSAGSTAFRSFGTYAVWFPRGLLLRLAARQACARLIHEWQSIGESNADAEVEATCARALADPELRFEAVCARIEDYAAETLGGNLAGSLTNLLANLEEQALQPMAVDDPGSWGRRSLGRTLEWVGAKLCRDNESDLRKSKLGRALSAATKKLAEEWDGKLTEAALELMQVPGRRVAAAEEGLRKFVRFCEEIGQVHLERLEKQVEQTSLAWTNLEKALESCVTGPSGFSFFGNRSRRQLRLFLDHLAAFSRQRMVEEMIAAGMQFFTSLHGKLEDRIRELPFCRQRLRNLQESLESGGGAEMEDATGGGLMGMESTPYQSPLPSAESYWETIRQSETAHLVLPDGEVDLENAANRFLESLKPEDWLHLDQVLQDQVLSPLGGLHKVCLTGSDLARSLATPILVSASTCLGDNLPITDVAQAEFSTAEAKKIDLAKEMREYFDSAAPLVEGKEASNHHSFLLLPASEAGKAFGEQAKQVVPTLEMVRVTGQADLMFCREQGSLDLEDLQRVLGPCRRAYEEAAVLPTTSPHCRFDINDWVPLDP